MHYVIVCDAPGATNIGPFESALDAERYDAVILGPCKHDGTHQVRRLHAPAPTYLAESMKYVKQTVWVLSEGV